jgi:hypothetical protein
MTLPPSRAEILAALQDPQHNDLASRVAEAMTAYSRAFEDEANRRGSLENIRLPAPTDEVEAVALEIFLGEIVARRRSREDFQGNGKRREDRPRPACPRYRQA